jgi:amino acid transporter
MALSDRASQRTAIILVIILFIIIMILSFFFGGIEGIFGVLKFFITLSLVVTFIGFVFYIVYFLFFKKHRRDIPYENWKSYMKSAIANGSDMMDELILTGDKHHSSKRFMTIKGYLRIRAFDNKDYDLFVGKRNTWNPLEDYKIIMLRPKQHSDLIGDVYVYGISLIFKYGFYFVNDKMLDFEAIDKSVAKDTFRSVTYDLLGDMKGIMDRATGLDAEFSKQRQQEKLLKIPILSGQQQQTQQPQQ